jgi:hypothetical protein
MKNYDGSDKKDAYTIVLVVCIFALSLIVGGILWITLMII